MRDPNTLFSEEMQDMLIYIPTRRILFTVTLLLLHTACTPQFIKDDEPITTTDSSYAGETYISTEKAVVPPATASQNTSASSSGNGIPKDPQQPLTTQVGISGPPVIPVAQQAKTKPISKVAAQPKSKSIKPDLSTTTDDDQTLVMLTPQSKPFEEVHPDTPALEDKTLNMAALPLSFGAHWSLDRRPNPVNHKTQCMLASRSISISDGYEQTDIQLLLTANSLYVKTDSNIDLSYPDTGIRLDDGTLRPFKGLAKETAAVISDDVVMLYRQMAPRQAVLVRLGFWPTWPLTETQEARFSLDGFDDAITALWQCEKM